MKRPIRIEKLGKAGTGYRVLASWKRPSGSLRKKLMDAWIPELTPSHILRRWLQAGILSWNAFRRGYRAELGSPSSQDFLKPLALLSRRRAVVILCDCADDLHCHHAVLAQALRVCRNTSSFTLSFHKKLAATLALAAAFFIAGLAKAGSQARSQSASQPEDLGPSSIDVSGYPSEHQRTYRQIFLPLFDFLGGPGRVINSPLIELDPATEERERRDHPELFSDPLLAQPSRDAWRWYVERVHRRPPCCGACPVLTRQDAKALWRFLVYDSIVRKTGANAQRWIRHRRDLLSRLAEAQPEMSHTHPGRRQ